MYPCVLMLSRAEQRNDLGVMLLESLGVSAYLLDLELFAPDEYCDRNYFWHIESWEASFTTLTHETWPATTISPASTLCVTLSALVLVALSTLATLR